MIGLGELTQHRTINRGVRNTFDVRGNHLERREAAHQRAHIVLVHDDEVPEWILCTCCINRNDAGLELFYRKTTPLAFSVKPLSLYPSTVTKLLEPWSHLVR